MGDRRLGIVMNGVTGRMGTHQHLRHAVLAIRREGGLELSDGTRVVPDPILVGRDERKLRRLAEELGLERWTSDLEAALAAPEDALYFDAVVTQSRAANVRRAIEAGKHVYCEKPTATTLGEAHELHRLAERAGLKHGVVQDKLWAPGVMKLGMLVDSGFFGRILTVRIDGCYWVFEGPWQPPQRPSWNYRKGDGGGMILDMFPHYRYLLELFGRVTAITCLGATLIPRRWDERGRPYDATADDAAFAILELEGGIVAQVASSWCVRVRRDDIITIQVDGTDGSAVAGLRECRIQPRAATPGAQWSLDVAAPVDFFAGWQPLPETRPYANAFRAQWELFIRHLFEDAPFPWNLRAGAQGVQLAELGLKSWAERRWVEVPELPA